jgi:hypothetical protein
MSNELQFDYTTGQALYCFIRNSDGQVNIVSGNTFEDHNADNISTYNIDLAENGGGRYVGDFNTNITSAGRYTIQVFLDSDAANPSAINPTDGDSLVGGGEVIWDGTSEAFVYDVVTDIQIITDALPNSGALTDIDAGINNIETQTDQLLFDSAGYVEASGLNTVLSNTNDIKTATDQLNFTGDDVKATLDSETVALSSTGLDNIAVTEPAARATTFREMVVQLWMRFFNKTDRTATLIRTYDENGVLVTSQTHAEVSGTTTVNKTS